MTSAHFPHRSVLIILFVTGAALCEVPPGVVINHIPSKSQVYVGSPGIAVLPNGDYLTKHDEFGPKSTEHGDAITQVFRSSDRGRTWRHAATVHGMYWASIFTHGGDAYLMGTSRNHGATVIRRSRDGVTWTEAKDEHTGILLNDAKYHCAPVPVVVHNGRIWRAMEDVMGPGGWGTHFRSFMMSAPADCDLLDASNWTSSNRIGRDPVWLDGRFRGWLEGNAVVTPEGGIVNILRVDYSPEGGKAATIEISDDGRTATFDPNSGFIDFPGGAKKFTIRFDPTSKVYWTLSNPVLPQHKDPAPARVRNALALMRSPDLRHWEIRCIVLYYPDVDKHGFQYVDWLFEGSDIIAASRTAYGEGDDAAHNQHDANYLTFHRFANFRELTMDDSAPGAMKVENLLSREHIIAIADAEARRRGYPLEKWQTIYDEENAYWKSCLAEIDKQRFLTNTLRAREDPSARPQPPLHITELEGRDFQVVVYRRREIMPSGDLVICVDRHSGEILLVIQGA